MKPQKLIQLLKDERPEAEFLTPSEGEWGDIDVVAVEHGRLSGHAAPRDALDVEILAASAHVVGRLMSETWAFIPAGLAASAKEILPIDVGIRVLLPQGRLGIARPATVRMPPVEGWVRALRMAERLKLAAEFGCEPSPPVIQMHGMARRGEDGFRVMLTDIFGARSPFPAPQRRELSAIEILRAVRQQFTNEKVIWL